MSTNTSFHPLTFFKNGVNDFKFLPFRFYRLQNGRVLLTNLVGEYLIISSDEYKNFISRDLVVGSELYNCLKQKHFLFDNSSYLVELLSSKYWTKKSFIQGFTKLHIFVLTLRCNSACTYCQASRQEECASDIYDMDVNTARKAVDMMFHSPSNEITVEFQGGEPLLNLVALKEVVTYATKVNEKYKKNLSFVVCTNLSKIDDELLDFFAKYKINISTSLDGPDFLHDMNRARANKAACHAVLERNIARAREALGVNTISALMTTTKQSLPYAKEIVDEYLRLKMGSIFIRALNPYGYAIKTDKAIGYTVQEFLKFYKECFSYILKKNREGIVFPEGYASMLYKKILTPWPIGFVDLQSPTGNGFAVTVYNYDGDVYASDESRMLYEMGDPAFRLGSVLQDTYEQIYFGAGMQTLAANGVAECLAGCSDCAFVPYCGADPVRHYATQHDIYGHRPSSSFCQKNKAIFEFLFEELQTMDETTEEILWTWLRSCGREEVSCTALGENDARTCKS